MGKGKDKTPEAPKVPSYDEQMQAYIRNIPALTQAQYNAQQQYALPMAQNQKDVYEQLYPGQSAIGEEYAGIARQDATGELNDMEREQYLSDIRANLGTNAGSQIGSTALAREMFNAGQSKKQGGLQLGLALSGRMPVAGYNSFDNIGSLTPAQSLNAQQATTNQNLAIWDTMNQNSQNATSASGSMMGMFGGQMMGGIGSGIGNWIGGGGMGNMFGGGTTGSNSAYTTRLTNSNNNVGNLGTGTYSNYNSFMA